MNATLFFAQRFTAAVLAFAVTFHLVTIIYAVQGGLTAGEILGRTRGDEALFAFYATFVIASAIHAPIGLRSVLREWTSWRGPSLDWAMAGFGAAVAALGLRAAWAVYAA